MSYHELIESLLSHATKLGADHAEAVMVKSSTVAYKSRFSKADIIEREESTGVGLRVITDGRPASVSTTDLQTGTIAQLADRAVSMAKLAPADPYLTIASEEEWIRNIPNLDLSDPHEPSNDHMSALANRIEQAALEVPGITNSEGASVSYSNYDFTLATSKGFIGFYSGSMSSYGISVLAGSGTSMERDHEYSQARHSTDLLLPEMVGKIAAERTLKRLNPRKVASTTVPVIYDPRVGNELLGYFLSAINGESIAKGTSFLQDAMGKQIFSSNITIREEPHLRRGLASRPFDGEGLPCATKDIVADGILQNWILDLRSAKKLGLKSTGNASRGIGSPPSPSTSNVVILPGTRSPKELLSSIQSGFYVTDTFGMGVNLVTGDYSQGASGFWIEHGELTYPVSEITIAGNLRDMFHTMEVANDLTYRYAKNTPTLCIASMTVAGS